MTKYYLYFLVNLCFITSLHAQTKVYDSASIASLKKEILPIVASKEKQVQEMVDMVFSFGELGFQEFETSRYVTGILAKKGFQIERGVAGIPTAWIATYGSGHQSAAVGKREFRLFLACKL